MHRATEQAPYRPERNETETPPRAIIPRTRRTFMRISFVSTAVTTSSTRRIAMMTTPIIASEAILLRKASIYK